MIASPNAKKPTMGQTLLGLAILLLVGAVGVGVSVLGNPYYAIYEVALFITVVWLVAMRLKECFELARGSAHVQKLRLILFFLVGAVLTVLPHLGEVIQSSNHDYIPMVANSRIYFSLLFALDLVAALLKKAGATIREAPGTLSVEVKALADKPVGKISAIALYREQTGADLSAAKEAVEAYICSTGPAAR